MTSTSMGNQSGKAASQVAELLAMAYLRYRTRQAQTRAREAAPQAKKPLDDVAPRGRVRTPENRTPGSGVER